MNAEAENFGIKKYSTMPIHEYAILFALDQQFTTTL